MKEREREREREFLSTTIKNGSVSTTPCRATSKVGKHNALSGNTASGRRAPAYDGYYYTPTLRLIMWHVFAEKEREREIEKEIKRKSARACMTYAYP